MAKISFGVSICDSIIGLRCYDSDGNIYINETWWDKRGSRHDDDIEICKEGDYEADLKEWVTHSI